MATDKEFAKVLEFTRQVQEKLRDNPDYKGAAPDNKAIKPMFADLEDDEFGGNENNRRVAKREAKEREVVAGSATEDDLKKTLTENATEVKVEQKKEETPKTSDEPYQTFSGDGKPVWKPNS